MSTPFFSTEQFLIYWQRHRALTRRVIEAFPEDKLFTHTIGGMRSFGEMILELISIDGPMVEGFVTGKWDYISDRSAIPKSELLGLWDRNTERMDEFFPQIPPETFSESLTAFGMYTDTGHGLLLYALANEIHHRGQGYVYLRSLGIDPPAFYEF